MQSVFMTPCHACAGATETAVPREGERAAGGRLWRRLVRTALFALVVLVMLQGLRFVLQQPSSSSEYAAATYVFSDAGGSSAGPSHIAQTRGARR